MRRRLWGQLMERGAADVPGMADGLSEWSRIAADNIRRAPAERAGFIVPYQLSRARRFGRPQWFVPDELV